MNNNEGNGGNGRSIPQWFTTLLIGALGFFSTFTFQDNRNRLEEITDAVIQINDKLNRLESKMEMYDYRIQQLERQVQELEESNKTKRR